MAASFSGGEALKAALEKLRVEIGNSQKVVRVGFLEGSHCGPDNDAPAPEIAYILEVGAPASNIPPRPYFRTMILKNKDSWGPALRVFLKKRKFKLEPALMDVGLIMGEQLQLSITETTTPPNKEWALKAKGHLKPLEWSKNMKRAVAAEVDDKKKVINGSA